jgi:hypothetical protein
VSMIGMGQGKNALNSRGILLPDAVKELMLIDEVLHPGEIYELDAPTTHELFGREVGAHYKILPETKKKLMEAFVAELKHKAAENADLVTEESVRATMFEMMHTGELCRNSRGKTKALSLRKFRQKVLQALE